MGSRRFLSTLISNIEIERKFHPTRPLLHALTRTNAAPPVPLPPSIARAHPGAVHFIRDVYYDSHDRLFAAGLWVRRRSVLVGSSSSCTSSWEAKVRVGGDFAASQFVEVEGATAVERELQRVLGGRVTVAMISEYLGVMSDLTTRRLAGRLELRCPDANDDDRLRNLTVVIDLVVETPSGDFAAARAVLEGTPGGGSNLTSSPDVFFHEIGELELMAEVRTEPAAFVDDPAEHQRHAHETQRKAVAGVRAAQLEVFMRAHPALFPMTPRPLGKLEAYFAWKDGRSVR